MKILDVLCRYIYIFIYICWTYWMLFIYEVPICYLFVYSEFFYYFPCHGSHLVVVSLFEKPPHRWRISRGRVMNRFKSWGISPKQGGFPIQEYSRIVWWEHDDKVWSSMIKHGVGILGKIHVFNFSWATMGNQNLTLRSWTSVTKKPWFSIETAVEEWWNSYVE